MMHPLRGRGVVLAILSTDIVDMRHRDAADGLVLLVMEYFVFADENPLRRFPTQMMMRHVGGDQEGDILGAVESVESVFPILREIGHQLPAPPMLPDQPCELRSGDAGCFADVVTNDRPFLLCFQTMVSEFSQTLLDPLVLLSLGRDGERESLVQL